MIALLLPAFRECERFQSFTRFVPVAEDMKRMSGIFGETGNTYIALEITRWREVSMYYGVMILTEAAEGTGPELCFAPAGPPLKNVMNEF